MVARPRRGVERAPGRGDRPLGVGDGRVGGHAEDGLGRGIDGLVRSRRSAAGTSSPSISSRSSCQVVTRFTLPRCAPTGSRPAPCRLDRSDYARRESLSRQEHAGFSTKGDAWSSPDGGAAIADFRAELHAWLDAHHDELAPRYAAPGTLDEQIAQMQRVKSILFDAGWMRFGWPERVGGLGGSPMLRTELGAALAARDLADPGLFSLIEVLAPTLIDFAAPALAAEVVPRLLSGAEMWCQGLLGTGHRQRPRVARAAAPFPTATPRPRRRG